MNWYKLENIDQLEDIKKASIEHPILIFKHSTTCPISGSALRRMEKGWNDDIAKNLVPYYLDLLKYRPISNEIVEKFGVEHESPQILLIKNGEVVYSESHFGISFEDLSEQL